MRRGVPLAVAAALLLLWGGRVEGAEAVTQGQLAVALAKRLSACGPPLCKENDPPTCSLALKVLGIEPPGGWLLERPATEREIIDLTNDVLTAAKGGKLACTPEKSVDLLAAACVDVGLASRDVYMTAYTTLGYYFPSPTGAAGGRSVSPSR